MTEANPLAADLDHVLAHTQGLWEELRGQRVFITGGTGFFGCWLLESFAWANNRLNLDATAVVLTRSVERFQRKAPHLASHPAIHFHIGDVRDFDFPDGHFAHVIHAATEAERDTQCRKLFTHVGHHRGGNPTHIGISRGSAGPRSSCSPVRAPCMADSRRI